MKSVSVIIPTYNYGRFISEAIRSALDQTHAALEILVVDDGSTDDTRDVVGKFGDAVKYVRQDNSGVCAARNTGVRESRGELIAFLDADDTWQPTALEKQAARFALDASIGLVHCGLREFDCDTGETIRLHLDGGEDGVAENLLLWEGPVIVGPGTVVVSREAFDAVEGFDTRMKVGEDWDFCYRVARRFNVGFVREPLLNYRNHPGAAHRNVGEMERGMSLFYSKAFANGGDVMKLRRRALGNFHRVLSGSYFQSGDYLRFLTNAAKSLWYRPAAIQYFMEFPVRRWRNRSSH